MATYEKDVNAFSEISGSQIFALFGQLIAYLGAVDDTTFQLYDHIARERRTQFVFYNG